MANLIINPDGSGGSGYATANGATVTTGVAHDGEDSSYQVETAATAGSGIQIFSNANLGYTGGETQIEASFRLWFPEGATCRYWVRTSYNDASTSNTPELTISGSSGWQDVTIEPFTPSIEKTVNFFVVMVRVHTALVVTFYVTDVVVQEYVAPPPPRPSSILTPGSRPIAMLTPH